MIIFEENANNPWDIKDILSKVKSKNEQREEMRKPNVFLQNNIIQ